MLCLLPRNTFHAITISIRQADRPIPTAALEDCGYWKMRRIWAVCQLVIRFGLAALGIYYCDSFTYLCMPPPRSFDLGGPSLTLVQQYALLSYLSFCSDPVCSAGHQWTVLFDPRRGWVTHCDLGNEGGGGGPPPPLPCQQIQTHIHNSAFAPSCLLYSHCWCYFLITTAHAPKPWGTSVSTTACPAARLRWGED